MTQLSTKNHELTTILQGTKRGERIGSEIYIKSIRIRGWFGLDFEPTTQVQSAWSSPFFVRLIVWQWMNEDQPTNGEIQNLFDPSLSTTNDKQNLLSFYRKNRAFPLFSILYDKTFKFAVSDGDDRMHLSRPFKIKLRKFKRRLHYVTSSSDHSTKSIYITFIPYMPDFVLDDPKFPYDFVWRINFLDM